MTGQSPKISDLVDELFLITNCLETIENKDQSLENISLQLKETLMRLKEFESISKKIESEAEEKENVTIPLLQLRTDLDKIGNDNLFLWTIFDVRQKFTDAYEKQIPQTVCSRPFYLNPFGYRLVCAITFSDEGLAIYLAVTDGNYDALLQWPIVRPIEVTLMSQTLITPNKTAILQPNNQQTQESLINPGKQQLMQNSWTRPTSDPPRVFHGIESLLTRTQVTGGREPDYISDYLRNDQVHVKVIMLEKETASATSEKECQPRGVNVQLNVSRDWMVSGQPDPLKDLKDKEKAEITECWCSRCFQQLVSGCCLYCSRGTQ